MCVAIGWAIKTIYLWWILVSISVADASEGIQIPVIIITVGHEDGIVQLAGTTMLCTQYGGGLSCDFVFIISSSPIQAVLQGGSAVIGGVIKRGQNSRFVITGDRGEFGCWFCNLVNGAIP